MSQEQKTVTVKRTVTVTTTLVWPDDFRDGQTLEVAIEHERAAKAAVEDVLNVLEGWEDRGSRGTLLDPLTTVEITTDVKVSD